jgi:hypothetical protein
MDKERENICDEQNNVPKYVTSNSKSLSDSTGLPATPQKSSVTLNMNLTPSLSKQDSFDSSPAQNDLWKDYCRQEISPEIKDTNPVFRSVGSFQLKSSVPDYSKPSPVDNCYVDEVFKPSVESVSYSELPKVTIEEPPKPAMQLESKPFPPKLGPKPPKVSTRTSSPRRSRSSKNYSFLEKFAVEDNTASETEEYKPSSNTVPYLDKYVKELDKENEFEDLLNFDQDKDDDMGLKTYTVYDRYMEHSPRSDLTITSKPKPYGGYIETTKPKPYLGFTEGSLPSSNTSSTADLSSKVEPQSSLYGSKPRARVPSQEGSISSSDKNGHAKSQGVSVDYSCPAEDDSAKKYDQEKKGKIFQF